MGVPDGVVEPAMDQRWVGWARMQLALIILFGVAAGTFCALWVTGTKGNPSTGAVQDRPQGPRITASQEAAQFFQLAGQQAFCFKYDGCLIDIWIEVEFDGKTTRLGERLGPMARDAAIVSARNTGRPEPLSEPSGYVTWVERSDGGKPVWDLAIGVASGGKQVASSRDAGLSTPAGWGSSLSWVTPGESLPDVGEVTLATLGSDRPGGPPRTAKLKCRVVK